MIEEKEDLKRVDKTQERIWIIEIIISEMKTKLGGTQEWIYAMINILRDLSDGKLFTQNGQI